MASEAGFAKESEDFCAEGQQPPIDHMDGLYATLMVLQAIASVRSGRAEPIDELVTAWRTQTVG